jgi:hypothetical protein
MTSWLSSCIPHVLERAVHARSLGDLLDGVEQLGRSLVDLWRWRGSGKKAMSISMLSRSSIGSSLRLFAPVVAGLGWRVRCQLMLGTLEMKGMELLKAGAIGAYTVGE